MKRQNSKLLTLLRDPATQSVLAGAAILVAILIAVWGVLDGWFRSLAPTLHTTVSWLLQSRAWPIWQALLILVCVAVLAGWLLRSAIRPHRGRTVTDSPSELQYRKVWGVLWGWPPPPGSYIAAGPLCPEHRLPVHPHEPDSKLGERHMHFECKGPEGTKGHRIEGPKPSQLIKGQWGDATIYSDVYARLKAEDLATTLPDATIQSKPEFVPVPMLPGAGNSYLGARYIDPPAGNPVTLNGIQFTLQPDSLVLDTNETIRNTVKRDDGWTEFGWPLSQPVSSIIAVYFLINSGNSLRVYNLFPVGDITLVFKDAPPILTKLALGQNLREWCVGNSGDLVREATDRKANNPAWRGLSKEGKAAVIDCLRIPVFACMRSNALEQILFSRNPTTRAPDTMGVHFTVFAVSIERQEPVVQQPQRSPARS